MLAGISPNAHAMPASRFWSASSDEAQAGCTPVYHSGAMTVVLCIRINPKKPWSCW